MLRFILTFVMLLAAAQASAEERLTATLYKQPYCGCCDGHADHLRANGYDVTVVETEKLPEIKRKHGVPEGFEGCHTIEIGGYVAEGHVPASIIKKLLRERPAIRGISLPGMPEGSPGMGGNKSAPLVVYGFSSAGEKKMFATQ